MSPFWSFDLFVARGSIPVMQSVYAAWLFLKIVNKWATNREEIWKFMMDRDFVIFCKNKSASKLVSRSLMIESGIIEGARFPGSGEGGREGERTTGESGKFICFKDVSLDAVVNCLMGFRGVL